MINRYRWYKIQLPRGFSNLVALLSQKPLAQYVNGEFFPIENSLNFNSFRFFWKACVFITQFDEYGSPLYKKMETVNFLNFAIVQCESMTLLRVENPGKSIRELLNAIELIVGLGFTCKLLTIIDKKPSALFECVEVVKLIKFKASDAVLGKDLIANMEFSSNQGIEFDSIFALKDLKYKIDSATYELICEGVQGQLTFMVNGTVKISGQLAPKLLHLVEMEIMKFQN